MNSIRIYTVLSRLSNKFLLIDMMSTDTHAHWGRMSHAEDGCGFQLKAIWAIKPESSRDNTITTTLWVSCTGSYSISSPISFPLVTCIMIRTCLLITGGLNRLVKTTEAVKITRTIHGTWQFLAIITLIPLALTALNFTNCLSTVFFSYFHPYFTPNIS